MFPSPELALKSAEGMMLTVRSGCGGGTGVSWRLRGRLKWPLEGVPDRKTEGVVVWGARGSALGLIELAPAMFLTLALSRRRLTPSFFE